MGCRKLYSVDGFVPLGWVFSLLMQGAFFWTSFWCFLQKRVESVRHAPERASASGNAAYSHERSHQRRFVNGAPPRVHE